jgi:hypothetical protein
VHEVSLFGNKLLVNALQRPGECIVKQRQMHFLTLAKTSQKPGSLLAVILTFSVAIFFTTILVLEKKLFIMLLILVQYGDLEAIIFC